MVRQRGAKAGPSRIKLCRKDSAEMLLGRDEGETPVPVDIPPCSSERVCCVTDNVRLLKTRLVD